MFIDGTRLCVIPRVNEKPGGMRATLPMGHSIETGSAVEKSEKGSSSVFAAIPVKLIVIITLLMMQLQSLSRMGLAILMTRFGVVGIVAALQPTGAPMGFVAQRGIIALSGMIIRNAVILIQTAEESVGDML